MNYILCDSPELFTVLYCAGNVFGGNEVTLALVDVIVQSSDDAWHGVDGCTAFQTLCVALIFCE
jgi:hypothetical protein